MYAMACQVRVNSGLHSTPSHAAKHSSKHACTDVSPEKSPASILVTSASRPACCLSLDSWATAGSSSRSHWNKELGLRAKSRYKHVEESKPTHGHTAC